MRSKRVLYPLLLLFSITVRIAAYCLLPEGTLAAGILKTEVLYNVIFFTIMISLMGLLKERKWLLGLVWVTFIDSLLQGPLYVIQENFFFLTDQQYQLFSGILTIPVYVFYIAIFFARKNPARIFFRCMTWIVLSQSVYFFTARFLHPISNPMPLILKIVVFGNSLLNILLAFAVLRTPDLRKPQYADFLE